MANKLVKAISYSGFGTVVRQSAQIAVTVVSARVFGPVAMGELAAILAVTSIIQLFGVTGLSAALVRAVKIEQLLPTAFTVALAMALVSSVTIFGFWSGLVSFFHLKFAANVGAGIAMYTALKICTTVLESVLMNRRTFVALGLIEVSSHLVALGIFIVALAYSQDFYAVVMFYVSQALASAVVLFLICRKQLTFSYDPQAMREIRHFSVPYSVSQIGSVVAANADNLLIGKLLGNSALGFYSRAYQLLVAPAALVGQVIQRITFSYISHVNNPVNSLREVLLAVAFPMALVAFQGTAVCWYFSRELIGSIYGPGWDATAKVLSILSLSMFFRLHYKLLESLLFAAGSARRVAKYTAIYAVSIVCVTTYFALTGDIYDIAYGVAGSIAAYWMCLYLDMRSLARLGLKEEMCFVGLLILAFIICFGLNLVLVKLQIYWVTAVSAGSFVVAVCSFGFVYRNRWASFKFRSVSQ